MGNLTEHKKLILYGRKECHLCEEMIISLRVLQKKIPFELKVIDIDGDGDLTKLYSERVPILYAPVEERELCHYFLDLAVVNAYLS